MRVRSALSDVASTTRLALGVGAAGPPPSATIPPVPGGKVSAGDVARLAAAVVTVAPSETLKMKWSATRASAALGGGVDQVVDLLANDFIASSSTTGRNLVLSANALEPGRGDIEEKHSTDVQSPPPPPPPAPPPRVCMSTHTHGKSCSDLGRVPAVNGLSARMGVHASIRRGSRERRRRGGRIPERA